MTIGKITPTPTILVAIDVSKALNDVLMELPGAVARRRRLVVPNMRIEHDRFIALLQSFELPVTAAFEATVIGRWLFDCWKLKWRFGSYPRLHWRARGRR